MPNGSTTKFVHAIAAISRAVVDVAIRQYLVVASELKIDELRYLRHQHQRDPEEASDGHRPARGRLPSERGWPTSLRCRIGTLRALVACQLLGVRREPGDRQERGRDKERGSAIDRLQPARAVAPAIASSIWTALPTSSERKNTQATTTATNVIACPRRRSSGVDNA